MKHDKPRLLRSLLLPVLAMALAACHFHGGHGHHHCGSWAIFAASCAPIHCCR